MRRMARRAAVHWLLGLPRYSQIIAVLLSWVAGDAKKRTYITSNSRTSRLHESGTHRSRHYRRRDAYEERPDLDCNSGGLHHPHPVLGVQSRQAVVAEARPDDRPLLLVLHTGDHPLSAHRASHRRSGDDFPYHDVGGSDRVL